MYNISMTQNAHSGSGTALWKISVYTSANDYQASGFFDAAAIT